MNKISLLRTISHFTWELPQTILGWAISLFYNKNITEVQANTIFFLDANFNGGISLGRYVIVSRDDENLLRHELAHTKQSLYLGPLYLLVIGIPSICWAGLKQSGFFKEINYYWFYTESWAESIKKNININKGI